jgi:hypothetical protein
VAWSFQSFPDSTLTHCLGNSKNVCTDPACWLRRSAKSIFCRKVSAAGSNAQRRGGGEIKPGFSGSAQHVAAAFELPATPQGHWGSMRRPVSAAFLYAGRLSEIY